MTRIASFVCYPLGMGIAVALFAALQDMGASIMVAMYAPIVLIAIAILAVQWRYPARAEWQPARAEVGCDLLFIVIVQVALPAALGMFAALVLAGWAHGEHASPLWPHTWPLLAQIAAMVLAVDFLRYWLHRACHRFDFLWRLHAVHHAPRLLYSLNAARFHPLEKTLHFCADTLPFLALGVAPEVIAGYFVVYSVNGSFQHSNANLRYGWLNYVVGSAETHRWHHACELRSAACNFGSSTVIWDLMFGTWRLPRDRAVRALGLPDDAYPSGFVAQMGAPFRAVVRGTRRVSWRSRVADALVRLRMMLTLATRVRRIPALARDPMRAQKALLQRILRANRDTTFGRHHCFAAIDGPAAFARQVPIMDFETVRPYVEAEIGGARAQLTSEQPTHYARTSGSTGDPKDVPLTPSYLDALRGIHAVSVALQFRQCPEAFGGRILVVVGRAEEGHLRNGCPYGAASAIVAGQTPKSVRGKFVVPADVFAIDDCSVKYLLILRLALAVRDITYIGAANPSTLLTLATLYRDHEEALIEDVRAGTFFLAGETPPAIMTAVRGQLLPDTARAAELAALRARATPPRLADLWPAVRLVVTWTCGSAGSAVECLRHELEPATRILELGYIASEFRGTITIGRRAGSGLPTLDTHYFEFAERVRWDRGERATLTLDQLRKGTDYYVIVTTPSGLYRYFINDLVRVTGFLYRTPLLKFAQKGKGVTSITGEKLYETQVLAAVRGALATMGRAARFVMMLADERACGYELYVETDSGARPDEAVLAHAVDARLAALNLEYAAKRNSMRLRPLRARWLRDRAADAYKQHCVSRGQRESQFKPPVLAYRKDFAFDIERFGADT